jgi:Animal haem peroxidase
MTENNFRYEKMLEINTAHNPSDTELNCLAKFMTEERKKIPAGYTYLGQFIDHDIALDSAVKTQPWGTILSTSIFNQRTPFLNLETIYGFDSTSNSMEPRIGLVMAENSKTLLKLGDTIATPIVNKSFVGKDLPRIPNSPMAQIVDSRNDENLAVAQTQVVFMRFHNAVVKYLNANDSTKTFEEARKIVIQHYQWIILRDYLPRIIKGSVLNDVLTKGSQFYFPNLCEPFMPLEFSVAAFRFGHSMIRNSYNWNRFFNDDQFPTAATLRALTELTGRGGLGGNNQLPSEWSINWNLFYKTPNSPIGKFNFAKAINTKLSSALGLLPNHSGKFAVNFDRNTSLSAIDLYRSRALGLPTGQEIAKRILGVDERILKPEQIAKLLPANLKYSFSKETPMWFYLLAESEIEEHGQTLGEVGSRIIAETFVNLIKLSNPSILKDNFNPNAEFFKHEEDFGMAQLLKFVKEEGNQSFDELNPIE